MLLGAALLVLLLSCSMEAGASARLPFVDGFDDGNLDGWTVTDSGDGSIAVDRAHYVSSPCSMHVRSLQGYDSAMAELDLLVNTSSGYVVEFDFNYIGPNHGFELFRDPEMYVILDNGHVQVKEGALAAQDVLVAYPSTWYHVKVLYNASNQTNTIWIDGAAGLSFGRDLGIEGMRLGDTYWLAYYGEVFYDDFKVYYEDEPEARPPTWLELPTITAVEDIPVPFDFTPYVRARDLSPEELSITHESPYVTGVVGRTVTFLFRKDILAPTVRLVLNDGRLEAPADVNFTVTPVDDPPVVHPIPPVNLTEDRPDEVDLHDYILDEDTPPGDLVLACDDPACVGINGSVLRLLVRSWVDRYVVGFTVSDGTGSAAGSFVVNLTAVNDPPTIAGIGELSMPFTITMVEGDEAWLAVRLEDEDGTEAQITVSSDYGGITALPNGTLHVVAARGKLGTYPATVTATDDGGAASTATLSVVVRNVNDPPGWPVVRSPANHTSVVRGASVTFEVEVADPDTALGQLLTVAWSSQLSGTLNATTSAGPFRFTTADLPLGTHNITVSVTDGEYTRAAWLELTVVREYVPPEEEEPSAFGGSTVIAAVAIAVALVAVGAVVFLAMRASRRRREEELRAPPPPPPPLETPRAQGPLVMEGDLTRSSSDASSAGDRLEAERRAEGVAATVGAVGPAPEAPVAPAVATEEEQAERERTRELREQRRALMNLPQGLPPALVGIDIVELATAIMGGERRTTPSGSPLVKIKGAWYRADRTDPDTFMKEWREPPAPAGAAVAAPVLRSREEKLERLEGLLASGKVSQETYLDLKGKYEREP